MIKELVRSIFLSCFFKTVENKWRSVFLVSGKKLFLHQRRRHANPGSFDFSLLSYLWAELWITCLMPNSIRGKIETGVLRYELRYLLQWQRTPATTSLLLKLTALLTTRGRNVWINDDLLLMTSQRPCHVQNTSSRSSTDVKQQLIKIVLRWETT